MITQIDRDGALSVTASRSAGAYIDATLCEAGGEIPLFDGEQPPVIKEATDTEPEVRSAFLSGGPSCKELIFTLNGLGGSNVNIVGGRNIIVAGPRDNDPANTIRVELNSNIQGGCNG